MKRFLSFFRQEPVLCISGILAALSMFAVPPDRGYLSYIDCSTLAILFSLMLVVAGLSKAGVFRALTKVLTKRVASPRGLIFLLVLVCFFLSAFVTNDVALITFVPFTIGLLGTRDWKRLIGTIVTETVAANLGSLITPMGNPQNLFLYQFYGFTAPDFLLTMLPLGAVSLVICLLLALFVPKGDPLEQAESGADEAEVSLQRGSAILWGAAFLLCLFCVAGFVPWWLCLCLVALTALLRDRKLFSGVDYSLLVTFVFFFLFVGNVARINSISRFVRSVLTGRELIVSALLSQVISNVPAATMLASFTNQARALLYGVNIGGLGTLIASMASLISYRRYAASAGARRGYYMAVFSLVNFFLLALLLLLSVYFF